MACKNCEQFPIGWVCDDCGCTKRTPEETERLVGELAMLISCGATGPNGERCTQNPNHSGHHMDEAGFIWRPHRLEQRLSELAAQVGPVAVGRDNPPRERCGNVSIEVRSVGAVCAHYRGHQGPHTAESRARGQCPSMQHPNAGPMCELPAGHAMPHCSGLLHWYD